MPRLHWGALCSVFAGLAMLGVAGCEPSSDGKEWVPSSNAQQQITQVSSALDNSEQKLCSGVEPYQFRDTIIVPNGWDCARCSGWATSIGTSHYQCGRLNPGGVNGFSWCAMDYEFCY
jgi:hypothetical protein